MMMEDKYKQSYADALIGISSYFLFKRPKKNVFEKKNRIYGVKI